MKINNVDISAYGAKLISKVINPFAMTYSKEWLNSSITPLLVSKKISYGSGTLELLIEGSNENELIERTSNFINDISDSVINFGDLFFYKVTVSSFNEEETFINLLNNLFAKKLKISITIDEKYKDYVEVNLTSSNSISIEGNLSTPCILEITPTQAMVDLTIGGICKDIITINNLSKDEKLIINGEDKTITVNGENKFSDTDMWYFPCLNVGINNITFSKAYFTGILKYKPRFR